VEVAISSLVPQVLGADVLLAFKPLPLARFLLSRVIASLNFQSVVGAAIVVGTCCPRDQAMHVVAVITPILNYLRL
jgi:hypothetical protein